MSELGSRPDTKKAVKSRVGFTAFEVQLNFLFILFRAAKLISL
jgi:hypothetical protein